MYPFYSMTMGFSGSPKNGLGDWKTPNIPWGQGYAKLTPLTSMSCLDETQNPQDEINE